MANDQRPVIEFSADEVFEMAESIEENGAAFYRKAASLAKEKSTRALLNDLSRWELTHLEIFKEMQEQLKNGELDPNVFDPDNEGGMYLRAMADGHVFDLKHFSPDIIKGHESMNDILKMALGLEKDSIIFYLGLDEFVISRTGREKVRMIIGEEMKHISYINSEMKKLQ